MTTDTLPTTRPHRLARSTSDKKIGGVAGGLGSYFSTDPVLFRIGFAVATLFSGAGAVAYLALLVLMPADDRDRTGVARPMTA
ncbi:MAG TPA: PspC domain-containing protein [Solirubrobacteraceae bacterium]|nr:PspC domain-containing protein [Solirubrobacteraceae bacterium]